MVISNDIFLKLAVLRQDQGSHFQRFWYPEDTSHERKQIEGKIFYFKQKKETRRKRINAFQSEIRNFNEITGKHKKKPCVFYVVFLKKQKYFKYIFAEKKQFFMFFKNKTH